MNVAVMGESDLIIITLVIDFIIKPGVISIIT